MAFMKEAAFINFDTGNGTIAVQKAIRCTASVAGNGDYTVTLDEGIDPDLCDISMYVETGDVAGAGTARIPSIIHTSATQKRILVRDDAGILARPNSMTLTFRRVAPIQ